MTEKMLAETLRNLERDGLVTRTGAECATHVAALQNWLEQDVGRMVRCQIDYDDKP